MQVDLDLGNYERFLSLTLSRDHNITTGKVYNEVIMKERRGDYLGKTVQVVPHVTDEIQVCCLPWRRVCIYRIGCLHFDSCLLMCLLSLSLPPLPPT